MRLNSSRDEDAASSLERFFMEEEGNFLLSLSLLLMSTFAALNVR